MDNNNHPLGFGLVPIFDNIPGDLRSGLWCVWKAKAKGRDKYDKIPFDAFGPLKTSEPDTWLSFDEAVELYKSGGYNGVGRLCERDGLTVIDIDRADTLPSEVKALGETYCERSPSGRGLRLVYRTDTIPDRDIKEPFEVYSGNSARFLTFTGHIFKQTPISSKNGAIKQLIDTVSQQQPQQTQSCADDDPFQGLIKPDFTSDDIKRFLSAIDPDSGHDIWFRVMQGLHHHYDGGAEGKAILDNWSRLSKDYDRREIDSRWSSLGTGDGPQVTAASIKRMALDAIAKVEAESVDQAKPNIFRRMTDDLLAQPHQVRWVVKGILERGIVAQVFGPPGAGKSFLAISLACSVVSGREWYGCKVRGGEVLYLAGEGFAGITRRVAAWRLENEGVSVNGLTVTQRAINFGIEADLKLLRDYLSQCEIAPRMVVIDTLARATAGMDENSSSDMGRFMESLGKIARQYDCTVLTVHHSGKAGTQEARGSSAIKGALDAEIRVTGGEGGVLVECSKMKDAEPFEPLGFALVSIPLPSNFDDEDGETTTSAVLEVREEVAEGAGSKLSRAGLAVLRAFEACWDNPKYKRTKAVPVDIPLTMGMDAAGEGLWESDVREMFERQQPDEIKPGTLRQRWRRGLDDAVTKDVLLLLDGVIVRQ